MFFALHVCQLAEWADQDLSKTQEVYDVNGWAAVVDDSSGTSTGGFGHYCRNWGLDTRGLGGRISVSEPFG